MAWRRTAYGAWSALAIVVTLAALVAAPPPPNARSQTTYPPLADVPSFDNRLSLTTNQETTVDMVVADLYADGTAETLVLSADGRLSAFSGPENTLILDEDTLIADNGSTSSLATSLAAGQFDTTPQLELVVGVSSGKSVLLSLRQKTADSAQLELASPPLAFGDSEEIINLVAAVDLDGDSQDEIIQAGANGLRRFTVSSGPSTLTVTKQHTLDTPSNVIDLAVVRLGADLYEDLVVVSSDEGAEGNGGIILGAKNFTAFKLDSNIELPGAASSVAAGPQGLVLVGLQVALDKNGTLAAFTVDPEKKTKHR